MGVDLVPGAPQNGGFMVAAYVAAAVILVGYGLSLWRRARSGSR